MSEGLVVWILQTGEPLHVDAGNPRPMRAMNLADTLVARGHRVVLWSADFDHINKRFRKRTDSPIELGPKLEIRLLASTGYRRNVGLARLLDHALLGFNLRRRLRSEPELPDVAFVGYPPIETAYVMIRRLRAAGVPTLLDVKDQWPAIFSRRLPRMLRPLGDFILSPYWYLARSSLRAATGLSAMADGFLQWATDLGGRPRRDTDNVFPLTTPPVSSRPEEREKAAAWWDANGVDAGEVANLCFVGSFSTAFDFAPVRDAARKAGAEGCALRFVLCGDGGELPSVRAMMRGLDNVVFPGWIDRPKIEVLATRSIATIAPYRSTPDFELSIPNKIVDSLGLGLPIISPLRGEVAALIDNDGVGVRYDDAAEDPGAELFRAIRALIDDETLRRELSAQAHELFATRFSFERVYGELADHLERMAREARTRSRNGADG